MCNTCNDIVAGVDPEFSEGGGGDVFLVSLSASLHVQ